jgi:hypothetical protein
MCRLTAACAGGSRRPNCGRIGDEPAMTNDSKRQQQAVRDARLGAALRENLKRRKAQARGRDTADQASTGMGEAGGPEEPASPSQPLRTKDESSPRR